MYVEHGLLRSVAATTGLALVCACACFCDVHVGKCPCGPSLALKPHIRILNFSSLPQEIGFYFSFSVRFRFEDPL